MKKFVKFFMFLAVLSIGTTTTLTSCDENQMEDFVESVNIVGTWSCTESVQSAEYPKQAVYHFNGYMTFNANHTFHDSNGDTGTWSIKNRKITLIYDRGFVRNVQFIVQDGYTPNKMVLTTTFDTGNGTTCLCSVTMRNVRR